MKTLYLDFDGVLHPSSAKGDTRFSQTDLLVAALQGHRCQVVVSSSWRFHHPLESLIGLFPEALRDRIVGCTGPAHIGRWPRYNEILADARMRRLEGPWIALDDSWIEFPPACHELVRCNPNAGLTRVEAQRIMEWLSAAPSASLPSGR